jgi:signal transduction histidine kinase
MTAHGGQSLMRMRLRAEQDVFLARQLGREVARAVGLEQQDQTRLATALSEVGRVMLAVGPGTEVEFTAKPNGVPTLHVAVGNPQPGGAAEIGAQLVQVGRLVDTLEVGDGETGTVVRMARRLPASAPRLTPERMDEIRTGLAQHVPGTPLDELNVQNQQLIAALDEVRAQRDDLARLNAELEETNRGVMALYHQLSDELEETNRGVVALYNELDEKSVQLRTASEAKSRFLANVSHELRAPVTAIIGLGRLLSDGDSDPLTAEGSVRLAVAAVGDEVEFTVADTGTGIPPELHERIFEEFYQVPGSQALSGRGTGLGLPYARRLVGILGGALRVTSEPGAGSTFTVSLPVSP